MKRRKVHTPRLVHIPITDGLRDQFGMQLHASLSCLEFAPSSDAFDALASIFNVAQLAIENDKRLMREARLINGGATALNQIQARVSRHVTLHPYEIAPIRVAVNTIDSILGRLDVSTLYLAMRKLNDLKRMSA